MPVISQTLDQTVQMLARSFGDILPRAGTATAASSTAAAITTTAPDVVAQPAGSLIGATLYTNGESAPQTLPITGHTVSSGTATLTYPTATDPGDVTFYIVGRGGRGYNRQQYVDAINAAIDNAAEHRFGTDVSGVPFAIELAGGAVTQMETRLDYPMPSGYQWLHEMDVLSRGPLVVHPHHYLNTIRAFGDDASGDGAGRNRVAQSFQLNQQALVAYIAVYMAKVGSPTDTLTCVVEGNGASVPNATAATNGTSATIAGTALSTRFQWVVFIFSPPMMLLEDTTYHLTLRRGGTLDASNYYIVGEDNGNNYANGNLSTRSTTTWTAVAGSDLLFAINPQADWVKLARTFWDYSPASTDQLHIRRLPQLREGQPVQTKGWAAISRPSTDATTVPLDPPYVLSYATAWLSGQMAGSPSVDHQGQRLAGALQRIPLVTPPTRMPLPGAVRIY